MRNLVQHFQILNNKIKKKMFMHFKLLHNLQMFTIFHKEYYG